MFFVAMVVSLKKLEQSGSHTPRLHGLPNLWWGQGPAAQVHPQAWQVRHRRALRTTDTHNTSLKKKKKKVWKFLDESKRDSPTVRFPAALNMLLQLNTDCELLVDIVVFLPVTSSGWAAPGWASGQSATWQLMGTSCRPSPITSHFSKPSSMDTERDCEFHYNALSGHQFISFGGNGDGKSYF